MPVRSVINQYRGVNAHLHSFWQGKGQWNRFHDYYVGQLMSLLKARLLPMGYTAELEESLHTRRDSGDPYRPVADVLITDLDPERAQQPSQRAGNGSQRLTVAQLVTELVVEERHYSAVVLFERSRNLNPDDAVAWIELLSPTNKRKGKDADVYQSKRADLLRKGIVFLEIDYLHETPPTFDTLLDYSSESRHLETHPYRIVVLDPRPDAASGPAFVREFDVDEPIPAMPIPLNGDDKLDFDFGEAYQKTFKDGLYGYD